MFIASWPLFGLAFLVPLLDVSLALKSAIAGGLLVLAEVLFWLGIFILGKPAVEKLKTRILASWRKKSD